MSESTFSFLITTDNHLGFKDNDHIRRKDSYMAFKEALEIARQNEVDFILLGGDLFHVNKPSASIEHKCIKIIRQHMNIRTRSSPTFKRIKGAYSHFSKVNHANYEDPNLTVPYPIMTIHGNHDDPTGPNSQSVCYKLATSGLLNYFGEVTSTKNIHIEPIILQKGEIKLALYGLGFIPDVKLRAAFDKGEVTFAEPPKDTFNVLVVHQNRSHYQENNFIPDEMFPSFIHLLIRGHEHATQSPEPLLGSKVNGIVYQPGSTVATSITIVEAAPKKVGLITVKTDPEQLYKMDHELISLKSCRCMLFRDISHKEIRKHIKSALQTSHDFKVASKGYVQACIEKLLDEYDCEKLIQHDATKKPKELTSGQRNIKDFVTRSSEQTKNSSKVRVSKDKTDCERVAQTSIEKSGKLERFNLPLVRIRIEYTEKDQRFDEREISSIFYPSRVANKDIVLFKKQKLQVSEGGDVEYTTFSADVNDDDEQEEVEFVDLGEKRETIDLMIENYFRDKKASDRLQLLSLIEYTNAVRGSGEDGNVISKVLNKKKHELFDRFKQVVHDEESALQYFDMVKIKDWFLSALHTEDVVDMTSDATDSDVIICD